MPKGEALLVISATASWIGLASAVYIIKKQNEKIDDFRSAADVRARLIESLAEAIPDADIIRKILEEHKFNWIIRDLREKS